MLLLCGLITPLKLLQPQLYGRKKALIKRLIFRLCVVSVLCMRVVGDCLGVLQGNNAFLYQVLCDKNFRISFEFLKPLDNFK